MNARQKLKTTNTFAVYRTAGSVFEGTRAAFLGTKIFFYTAIHTLLVVNFALRLRKLSNETKLTTVNGFF